jgi:hypothetical protein
MISNPFDGITCPTLPTYIPVADRCTPRKATGSYRLARSIPHLFGQSIAEVLIERTE